jgi:hypothetical protein
MAGLLAMWSYGAAAQDACEHDREALLALPEQAFDQDLSNGGGGWRGLAAKAGCETVAADLLRDYRARHGVDGGIMAWHEGQVRANAGQYTRAEVLFESARKPQGASDAIGWNHYVDASIAFLRDDRGALEAARERLAAVPYDPDSGMPPLKDGYIEFPVQGGAPSMRVRWPPNIEVVDALIHCFGKPYKMAYGDMACRMQAAAATDESPD